MSNIIIDYLNSFNNKTEKVNDILQIIIDISKSKSGSIFLNENVNNFTCISHIGHTFINLEQEYLFEPISPINNVIITINSNFYKTPYDINSLLIIPIIVFDEIHGIICLENKDIEYTKDDIIILKPYITICQLILNKQKLLLELKNVYSNTNSFSKDMFFANMSHEIRTPLNGIIGYNQLLMQTNLTTIQKGYLTSMNQCSIQLMQIINDVLDFSKLSSGKMSINIEYFRIKEIIELVNDAISSRIIEKKQTLTFDISKNLPEFILSDKYKIIQIIINLVSNASKFSDINKNINVIISKKSSDNILQISVKDSGIGISEKNQLKLFNAFEQIQENMSKIGTGLGLAICKRLVELLNGQIYVKSVINEGSIFSFTFKYEPYEDFEKIIERDVQLLQDKCILVVDDNADNRILLFEMLCEWGMNPIICASSLEALRMILGNKYNFCMGLIDICMPGTTGIELAIQIKEEKPFFPLIALSSIDSFVNCSHFERKLDKPINKIQLFNAIHTVLSKKQYPISYLQDSKYLLNKSLESNSLSSNYSKEINILIAEDLLYNRTLLVDMLNKLGYNNIHLAENGDIAVKTIVKAHQDNKPYDIFLLDLRMPIMDGYHTMLALKKLNIKLPNIVIVTASVNDTDKEKCKSLGAKYFICKPIEMQELKEVILFLSSID